MIFVEESEEVKLDASVMRQIVLPTSRREEVTLACYHKRKQVL